MNQGKGKGPIGAVGLELVPAPSHQNHADVRLEEETNLTQAQLQRMEKMAEAVEESQDEVNQESLMAPSNKSTQVVSPKLQGSSGNKFHILSELEDDLGDGKISPQHQSPAQRKKSRKTTSSQDGAETELLSEEDSIDTSMPLSLILKSNTKIKTVDFSQRSNHSLSNPSSPQSLQASDTEQAPKNPNDPETRGLSDKDNVDQQLELAASFEELEVQDSEPIQIRQYTRGSSRGRPRGRGSKHHR